jgi:hypothetical protein
MKGQRPKAHHNCEQNLLKSELSSRPSTKLITETAASPHFLNILFHIYFINFYHDWWAGMAQTVY